MPVRHDVRLRLAPVVIALVANVCGCDKGPAAAPTPTTRTATHRTLNPGRVHGRRRADGRKPGFATGRVLRQDGQPIAIEGVRIAVSLRGVSNRTTQVVSYSPPVGPDGTYEMKVDDGTYRPPTGMVGGPVQRAALPIRAGSGAAGHGRDRVEAGDPPGLRLAAERPAAGVTPDETRAAAWHGGPITMQYQADRPDLGRRLGPAAARHEGGIHPDPRRPAGRRPRRQADHRRARVRRLRRPPRTR